MPVIRVETNINLEEDIKKTFCAKLSAFASEILAKPESVMMVTIIDALTICFASSISPAAYLEIRSVGLKPEKCGELTERLCVFIKNELDINPERTYIEYSDIDPRMFGWNNRTLA